MPLQVQEGFIVDEEDDEGVQERRRRKRRREEREDEALDEEDLDLIGETFAPRESTQVRSPPYLNPARTNGRAVKVQTPQERPPRRS